MGRGGKRRARQRCHGVARSSLLTQPARATCRSPCLPSSVVLLHRIGRSLVRVMRNYREIQFVVLSNIVDLARTTPELFRRYLKDFYIGVRRARACRRAGEAR